MRVLIDIGHPAHVHFFKEIISQLEKKGHELLVTTMDKEVSIDLLTSYGIEYHVVGEKKYSKVGLIFEWIKRDYEILKIAKRFKPDILMGISNPCIAHSSWILGKKSIIFDDTEHASFAHKITYPFSDLICTPSSFKNEIGSKQLRYAGYHELAYLHPNYYSPNPAILDEIGLTENDNIFLLRFSAFVASHDTQTESFKKQYILPLIEKLEKKGKVIISSEKDLEPFLQKYQYSLSPAKYHDLLYYSKMYIGEGSTTAEEAAILGVPSLHFERLNVNGEIFTITSFIGILEELQNEYELLYSYKDENELLTKVDELLLDIVATKKEWNKKRDVLLKDKIDVAAYVVQLVENYHLVFDKMKDHSEIEKILSTRIN